jgi:putative ABC transport system ATP-binding protein
MDIQLSGVKVLIPQTNKILFEIDQFGIPPGFKLLIHGPSGIGKTTLLHLIAGLFRPAHGKIIIGGHNISLMDEKQRCQFRRKYLGMFLQKLNLVDHLTGLENVRLGLFDAADSERRAWDGLRALGMESFARQLSGNLSMGEQQRMALARVIAAKPAIVLADEPTSSLDQENVDLVMDAIFSLSPKTTLVVVSHDQRIRSRFSQVCAFEELVRR